MKLCFVSFTDRVAGTGVLYGLIGVKCNSKASPTGQCGNNTSRNIRNMPSDICAQWVLKSLRKHSYSNILKISPPKTESFQIIILIYFFFFFFFFFFFSYFCSKHRMLVPVRTASPRRFERVHIIYVLSRKKKNNVYPCIPQFYFIKTGFKGVKII